jgi:hypothetical protein
MNDVSTIVSLMPYPIHEHKPGMNPAYYDIPAAPKDGLSVLHIGYSKEKKSFHQVHHFIFIDSDRGSITVPDKTIEVANAIILDYVTAQIEQDVNARPGMFAVEGLHEAEDIEKKFPKELAAAKQRQINWFKRLVASANDEWAHSRKHKNISNLQRDAARYLNVDVEWTQQDQMMRCPACQASVNSSAILCGSCGFILKPEQYKPELFAGGAPTIKK